MIPRVLNETVLTPQQATKVVRRCLATVYAWMDANVLEWAFDGPGKKRRRVTSVEAIRRMHERNNANTPVPTVAQHARRVAAMRAKREKLRGR